MNQPSEETFGDDAADVSLTALRIAAALGAATSVALIVIGFSLNIWWGGGAVFVSPIIPLAFVVGVEAFRR